MPRRDQTPRDLLFGLLALQIGLIDQDQIVTAFSAWSRAKGKTLAEILIERGSIDEESRALLAGMAEKQLMLHGGDAEKSLAAVALGSSTREKLAALEDADLAQSLPIVGSKTEVDDPYRTVSPAPDTTGFERQRFQILRPHARGGLGAVYVALDGELNREVALKEILDKHADDPHSRSRFLIEAEITGGLEHPGIVPVYGLGHYGDGRPYYAMRFIRGDSLKEAISGFHADESLKHDPGQKSLALRKLLRRFVDVCNAIDYAHGRGVLHRDLKPGNVIVGKYGETLVVDWGLAKAMGQSETRSQSDEPTLKLSSTSGSVETQHGSAIGTPAFMSPEQAIGDIEKLGPRSDVYSLGATLYCLLTGRAPFEGKDLGEVLRQVQKGQFPPPRQVAPTVDKALEAVCLKAMALKPEARHATARALADDIERWAADEPTSAWAEPFTVRARRWMRRNRTAVTAASVALVVALAGTAAVLAVQTRANADLRKANGETLAALAKTEKAQKETAEALAQSEESRKQAEAVGTFLVGTFQKSDPYVDSKDVKVADILDQALAELDKGFTGSKATEGALLDALGKSYLGLGLYSRAEEAFRKALAVFEEALGPDHPNTLTSRHNLALAYQSAGHVDEAIALNEATLKQFESKLGPDHPETLRIRNNLTLAYYSAGRVAEALPLFESTLRLRESKLGPDHPETLQSRNNLAGTYCAVGRVAEAIPLFELTLKQRESKLGADHPDTLITRSNLAGAYYSAGRVGDAIALNESTLKLRESKLGPDHPETLTTRNNLALAYQAAGRVAEAIPIFEATLKQSESKLGPDHPETLTTRNNLAGAYYSAGRIAEAIAIFEATLKQCESKLGPDHPETLTTRNNLAGVYQATGGVAKAIPLFESTLRLRESKLGADHPDTLATRNNLASAYDSLNRWADSEAIHRDTLARRRTKEKPDSPVLASALATLGINLLKQAKWSEAEPLLRECLAIRVQTIPDDFRRFNTASLLGGALLGQGKYAEAEPLIIAGYEGMKAQEAKIPPPARSYLTEAGQRVVQLYRAWGQPEKAAERAARFGLAELPTDVFPR